MTSICSKLPKTNTFKLNISTSTGSLPDGLVLVKAKEGGSLQAGQTVGRLIGKALLFEIF